MDGATLTFIESCFSSQVPAEAKNPMNSGIPGVPVKCSQVTIIPNPYESNVPQSNPARGRDMQLGQYNIDMSG